MSVLGGILLIIGAYFVYRGQIFTSVFIYILADVCWVILAIQREDYLGSIFISVGMLLGLLAYLKMNTGIMEKTLRKI